MSLTFDEKSRSIEILVGYFVIVVIDDDLTNVKLMQAVIEKYCPDAKIKGFTNPNDALNWLTVNTPDVIFVDYLMPQMDGVEFISLFKALPSSLGVPLVMVTGTSDDEIRIQALQNGVNDFVQKPINHIDLGLKARNLRDLHKVQRHWQTKLSEAIKDIERSELEMLKTIATAAEYRDTEKSEHTQRVGHLSYIIARGLGLEENYCQLIKLAAPLHDIGKIGISDTILLKPGKLTEEEFSIMKRHPKIGYEIARKSQSAVMQMAATISLSHHERFDGMGYPYGIEREHIPLVGRIVAIADVFDALTVNASV